LGVQLEVSERDLEVILERVKAVEDAVVEALLTQIVPDILDRVEFGSSGRQLFM
jgi:hypothetical protein